MKTIGFLASLAGAALVGAVATKKSKHVSSAIGKAEDATSAGYERIKLTVAKLRGDDETPPEEKNGKGIKGNGKS